MNDDRVLDDPQSGPGPSRRQVLFAGAGALAAAVFAACGGGDSESTASPATTGGGPGTTGGGTPTTSGATTATTLAPTPSCDDGDEPTPAQTEGPYFKANSPQQADLRSGAGGGTALNLAGTVVTTGCQPVNAAKIEFWQADNAGEYDNSGYTLRGHQFTDAQGRYALQTIVPGLYPGRTRHIHVMVQAPNGKVLTTQLYFPGEPGNASDGIYRAECLIDIRDTSAGKDGTFTFALNG
jgi:protocatechuate 3,4-dioxygenase beta subunit